MRCSARGQRRTGPRDRGRRKYDPAKSAENKRKHGIDFAEAQALCTDPAVVEIPARVTDEPRWVVIGRIEDKHWSAVITRRNENIRLISVRH
jgi:uncharacterized DUF497 family protein